jgi:hypothetical protein
MMDLSEWIEHYQQERKEKVSVRGAGGIIDMQITIKTKEVLYRVGSKWYQTGGRRGNDPVDK